MKKKLFSMRSLFMPVVISSAATVFLISVFVTNQLFYKPTVGYAAGEGSYAAATINFSGVPASGSYFLLQDSWGNDVRFEVQGSIPGSQNGEFQNGAYIIAGDGADTAEIASRTQSVLLTKYNDNTIIVQPTLEGNTITLTETRVGDPYNRSIEHSADSNWVISDFTGGVNPDPDPVIGSNADTAIGVYIVDDFGKFINETIQAQNNSEDVTWPMGGSSGPYIGLANQKFDIVYFDVRGSTWDTEASPTVQYSKGSGEWGNISEAVFDPTPTPFNIGTSQSSITSISFTPPEDWEQNTVDSKTAYYIRFSETSSGVSGATVRQISLRAHVANAAPTVSINSADAYQTGTGDVSFTATVNDTDTDNVSIRFQFQETTCGSMLANGTVSTTASGANSGALTVSNSSDYQISGISTASSDEFVSFVWESANDVPNADGVYCLSFTPYDGTTDGTAVTTTVTLDNVAPTQPGNLSVSSVGTTRVTFTLPTSATSSDSNFSQYKIHYTTGTTVGVGDSAHDGTFGDEDLSDASFNGTDSTTITGLTAETLYTANIYAYDSFGNSTAASTTITFSTLAFPIATNFTTSTGSTDLSAEEDLSAVSGLKLASEKASIVWTNPVNVQGADYNSNVVVGSDFVSVNAEALDATIDSPATVTLTTASCEDYTIYYAPNFYSTRAQIVSNGQVCDATTDPACTVLSCIGDQLTFTVPHFDGFAVDQNADVQTSFGGGGQILRNISKPVVFAFDINGGVTATDQQEVNIRFGVTDAVSMAISNNPNFTGSSFVPFETDVSWRLSDGAGDKKVYVKFVSKYGVETEAHQMITFDPTGNTPEEQQKDPILKETVVKFDDIQSVSTCELPEGYMYYSGPKQPVYFVTKDCTRKGVRNARLYFSYFSSFVDLKTVEANRLEQVPLDPVQVLPYGPLYALQDSMLVKTIDSPMVYLIDQGVKRFIPSAEVFLGKGYLWNAIIDITEDLLNSMQSGAEVTL